MIIRENRVRVDEYDEKFMIHPENMEYKPSELIFFDLEHYVYKKPKCIGVFGACEYSPQEKAILVTQYMIEDREESIDILYLARDYFKRMKDKGKKAIVTFSGNNDFTVINYLLNKYGVYYNFDENYDSIDIQKEYEKFMRTSIGLKKLEKIFEIEREGEVISGSNLAKTFHKIMKDKTYFKRMPEEKIEKILLYNEQDVVNLYYIYIDWQKYINEESRAQEENERNELNELNSIIEDLDTFSEELNKDIIAEEQDEVLGAGLTGPINETNSIKADIASEDINEDE